MSADWQLLFVYFWFCKKAVFFTLFYPSTSPQSKCFDVRAYYLFLHSLTKAPNNNTPIKITSSPVSAKPCLLRVLLQLHFGVVADRFFCYSKLRNKSPQQKFTCHQGQENTSPVSSQTQRTHRTQDACVNFYATRG